MGSSRADYLFSHVRNVSTRKSSKAEHRQAVIQPQPQVSHFGGPLDDKAGIRQRKPCSSPIKKPPKVAASHPSSCALLAAIATARMSHTLQAFLVAALLGAAQCCIFKFGSNPEDLVSGHCCDEFSAYSMLVPAQEPGLLQFPSTQQPQM
jgi:hypothetical protein